MNTVSHSRGVSPYVKTSILPQGAVSPKFLEGARALGLENPLVGLHDSRIRNPDVLLRAGWIRETRIEAKGEVNLYRYPARGETFNVQTFIRQGDGWLSLATTRRTNAGDAPYEVEQVTRHPRGSINYDYYPFTPERSR